MGGRGHWKEVLKCGTGVKKGASENNGFIHRAAARQEGSFTSVLVHPCNIYRGQGNYAVRHRGGEMDRNLNTSPVPRDSHQLLVKRTQRG